MAALVRLVSRMGANVLLEMRQLRKLALANLTAVGLDSQVDACVLGQVRGVGEGFGTLRTLVRLGLSHVDLGMELQVCFAPEYLWKRKKNIITQMVFQIMNNNLLLHLPY